MVFGRYLLLSAVRRRSASSKLYNSGNNNSSSNLVLDTRSVVHIGNTLTTGTSQISRMACSSNSSSSSDQQQVSLPKKNRLALEKSSYLLQHATNPVDWYPWGEEAFQKAKKEDKLIFLSVGYSTCHWCHVMEHESFQNEQTAKIMNTYYVNIKVDREERPDVDRIYMTFIQTMSQQGGWPMSVFLTPDLLPIMAGTYIPPVNKFGQPSFPSLLLGIANKWHEDRQQLIQSGSEIYELLKMSCQSESNNAENFLDLIKDCDKRCIQRLIKSYDQEYGGFSKMPKFPQPVYMNLLFHMYARNNSKDSFSNELLDMCLNTLKKISNGGIHDHIGQGFSRYSVDEKWHVPHFEKMLYDQAQLLRSYANAFVVTKDPYYKNIVDDIVTYITRDLGHSEGGFYSAEDADSLPSFSSKLKKEGAFYVWTQDEINSLLSKQIDKTKSLTLSQIFSYHFNVKSGGNLMKYQDPHGEMTDKNVLIVTGSIEETAEHFKCSSEEIKCWLEEARLILFEARSKRPRPHLDAKIIAAWNGLMISGLAHAGIATKNPKYIERAEETAKFIEKYLFDKEKKILLRSCYREDDNVINLPSVPIEGFHADYACVVQGLLDLYEATMELHWLEFAEQLQNIQDPLFWDSTDGGYFATIENNKDIILRLKDEYDYAEPSSNSVACNNLLRLAAILDCDDYLTKAQKILQYFSDILEKNPIAVPELVCAYLHFQDATTQFFIVGKKNSKDTEELLDVIRSRLIPAKVALVTDPDDTNSILWQRNQVITKMTMQKGRATVYVCRHRACSLPVVDPHELAEIIDSPQ